jgi:2-phosphosulfolactate phosphatase
MQQRIVGLQQQPFSCMKQNSMGESQLTSLEVLFTPADFAALKQRDLSDTFCVVFDVLRATSSMVTALANGADAIIPVAEIPEALTLRREQPEILLAGERDGMRIGANLTGSIAFDLGNSPREFTREQVRGRTIAMTTTNGTRALRACAHGKSVLIGSFLSLRATARCLEAERPAHLLLVCSGTHEETAYEDVLAAGALCDAVWPKYTHGAVADSALMARNLFRLEGADLEAAFAKSRNGRRLLSLPELSPDVAYSAQLNSIELVAALGKDGLVRRQTAHDTCAAPMSVQT